MSQLLPFLLGEELYATELTEVQEVVENCQIFPIPGAPPALRGAISFHGRIVPVVDLPLLIGFPAGPRAERLLVLTDRHGPMALAVDQLRPVLNLNLAQGALDQSRSDADCIRAVISWRDTMFSLLDFEQLQIRLEQICARAGG